MTHVWRSLATAALFCWLCGMTLAAIVISAGVVLETLGVAELASAVGIVAIVQLILLIKGWRRRPSITEADKAYSNGPAATAANHNEVGDDRSSKGHEPGMPAAGVAPRAGRAAAETVATDIHVLDQGELELQLEPLVEVAEARTVYYRASLVLTCRDGSRVDPYVLAPTAKSSGFAPVLDLALFRRVCPVIRHLKSRYRRPGVFCPLSPHSFAQRDVLDELVQFLRANQDAAGAMVIDISQPALAALSPDGMDGLAYLAELGATLSLSEARLDGPDFATLAVLGFRFLDLDLAMLAGTHGWEAFSGDAEICRLAGDAEQAGLTVIAANVVRAEELASVRPFARLARGSLFSPPRAVRREITDPPVHAAAA